jgi:serine/threonine-protein kinase
MSTGSRPIPEDLLREASQRLGVIAALAGVLWIVTTVIGHLILGAILPPEQLWPWFGSGDMIAFVSGAASLAVFVYSRKTKRSPTFILNLGLVYMVATSAAIGMINHWDPAVSVASMAPQISWIGVVVLIFSAIVPSSTPKMITAGLISVLMNPVAMLIEKANGSWNFGPWYAAFIMHYPDILLVGVAVVIARVVTGLGQKVGKAREMGSYQLGDLIKRGGMGEVYRAKHRMLARPAAIKLIRPEMIATQGEESTIAVKRFYREAEAAATLRSPHTVELFDFGVTDDQTLYFVMELLDGMDLETLVKESGPLPASRVVYILRQVCDSLEEAHARGLIHRDIKPANIHVGRVGLKDDFVKVLDFGLVKAVASGGAEHSLGTEVGRIPGTPAYMAPEMSLGEKVDGRADIYAVGCVAYFLLSGRLVFEAENMFQMLAQHLRNDPVPPSLRSGVPIPDPLERLVLSCLAKKPDARPRSAAELSNALAALKIPKWTDAQASEWWAGRRVTSSTNGTSPHPLVPAMSQ